MIVFDVDTKNNRGTVSGEEVSRLREEFSVENKAAKFTRMRGRYMPFRKYVITPTGKFDIGLYYEFRKFLKKTYKDIKIVKSEKFISTMYPNSGVVIDIPTLTLELRD